MDQLSVQQFLEYYEAFTLFDRHSNGFIGLEEFAKVMTHLEYELTEDQLKDMMNDVNAGGNGTIDYQQFLTIMARLVDDSTDSVFFSSEYLCTSSEYMSSTSESEDIVDEDMIVNAFRVLDKEGDGFISAKELRHLLTNLGEKMTNEEVDHMLRDGDIDGEGLITCNQFAKMLTF